MRGVRSAHARPGGVRRAPSSVRQVPAAYGRPSRATQCKAYPWPKFVQFDIQMPEIPGWLFSRATKMRTFSNVGNKESQG